jgi:hypothetical protein
VIDATDTALNPKNKRLVRWVPRGEWLVGFEARVASFIHAIKFR